MACVLCVKHSDISVYLLLEEVRLCGHYSGACVRRGERKTRQLLNKSNIYSVSVIQIGLSIFCITCDATHNADVKSGETGVHSCGWTESRLLRVERDEDNEENNSQWSQLK